MEEGFYNLKVIAKDVEGEWQVINDPTEYTWNVDLTLPEPVFINLPPNVTNLISTDITITGSPAISVPCGFTPEGLPVGVQLVGRYQDDFGVLQLAYAFEQATQFWRRRPALVM